MPDANLNVKNNNVPSNYDSIEVHENMHPKKIHHPSSKVWKRIKLQNLQLF